MDNQSLEQSVDPVLHNRMLDSGRIALYIIRDEHLAKRLCDLALDISSRKFSDVKVVDGNAALLGTGLEFVDELHLVYGRENKEHPEYNPQIVRLVHASMYITQGKYDMCFPLNTKIEAGKYIREDYVEPPGPLEEGDLPF